MSILSLTMCLHAPSTGPSNCTSDCLLLGYVPGHGWPGPERGLDLSGEGDADRAGGSLAVGKVASPQPVVDGARLDAEAGGGPGPRPLPPRLGGGGGPGPGVGGGCPTPRSRTTAPPPPPAP